MSIHIQGIGKRQMPVSSPYKSLPVETRMRLVERDLESNSGSRAAYIMQMVKKGGGFRPATLRKWPVSQLAREIVRRRMETLQDEIGYLQMLYVELEPEIQCAFCDAAGVAHENGEIPEELPLPLSSEELVGAAAQAVIDRFGERGRHYLTTISVYNPDAWPGLGEWLEGHPPE